MALPCGEKGHAAAAAAHPPLYALRQQDPRMAPAGLSVPTVLDRVTTNAPLIRRGAHTGGGGEKSMSEEPLAYTCPCGSTHPCASVWGAAHWHEELLHTCTNCGRRNTIRNGVVLRSKQTLTGKTQPAPTHE